MGCFEPVRFFELGGDNSYVYYVYVVYVMWVGRME